MNPDIITVYYGISFNKIPSTLVKEISNEILSNDYLKKISYYFDDPQSIKTSNKIKRLTSDNDTLKIDVLKIDNVIVYKYMDEQFKSLIEITKKYKVMPKFYLKSFDILEYKRNLAKLEHKKSILKNKEFAKYNKLFNRNFNVLEGINSIYEWYTGAVYFKDYEWEEIGDNPLKSVFEIKENNSYIYSLPLDDGIILRGADIYYYFSSDVSRFEKPNMEQIEKWYDNCQVFLDLIKKILNNYIIKSNYDLRLLLGVTDNIRNIILLMYNTELLSIENGKNFIYKCDTTKSDIVENYTYLINLYMEIIEDICLTRPVKDNIISLIKQLIIKTKKASHITMSKVKKISDSYLLSKCFNPLREIDNYFENYITCKYALKQIIKNNSLKDKKIHIVGVLYGGLELPFILQRQLDSEYKVYISLIYQNHGMYLDRQNKDKSVIANNLIEIGKINKNITTYIVDDNMMSGITIQFIYNQLFLNNYSNINGVIAIRHPNINRIAQLEYFKTAINIDEVDKTIFGMLTDTPYSKIKSNSNYNNMFVNELNIFSIMTEVFLKALYKNNTFIKDSQVDIFLGYSGGKKR